MERVIYGPRGDVARRVVLAGGKPGSTIYRDPDSKKLLVHTVFDAGPALKAAHDVREHIGPWSPQKNFRMKSLLPVHLAIRMKRDAMLESQRTGEDAQWIFHRMHNAFLQENPRFRT